MLAGEIRANRVPALLHIVTKLGLEIVRVNKCWDEGVYVHLINPKQPVISQLLWHASYDSTFAKSSAPVAWSGSKHLPDYLYTWRKRAEEPRNCMLFHIAIQTVERVAWH
jgi:hypothetical protein